MKTTKEVLDLLSGALTPLIAIIASYVAYQQYRVQKLQFRHASYERRLGVYRAVRAFLAHIIQQGKVDYATAVTFYSDTSEAVFLFRPDVRDYIDLVYKQAIELASAQDKLYPFDGDPGLSKGSERSKTAAEKTALLLWFGEQIKASEELFRKHITIGD